MYNNELYHFGVKGMKWGVRRYQNADGTLTPKGRERVSKQYKKYAVKAATRMSKNYTDMYVNSYNKAANDMNNGLIDDFNKQQEKKYGKGFAQRKGYESDYEKLFNERMTVYLNKAAVEFYDKDANYQKGKALVEKYGMDKWDDLAKKNTKNDREVRAAVEKEQQNHRT